MLRFFPLFLLCISSIANAGTITFMQQNSSVILDAEITTLSCADLLTGLKTKFGTVTSWSCTDPLYVGKYFSGKIGASGTAVGYYLADWSDTSEATRDSAISDLKSRVAVLESDVAALKTESTPTPLDEQQARTLFFTGMLLIVTVYTLALGAGKALRLMGWHRR